MYPAAPLCASVHVNVTAFRTALAVGVFGTTPAFTLSSSLQSPSGVFLTRASYVLPLVSPVTCWLYPGIELHTAISPTHSEPPPPFTSLNRTPPVSAVENVYTSSRYSPADADHVVRSVSVPYVVPVSVYSLSDRAPLVNARHFTRTLVTLPETGGVIR